MSKIDEKSLAILEADAANKEAVKNGTVKLNKFHVDIDGKDYTANTVFPIKWSKLLDERLDETRLSMKRVKDKIISPLTKATVTLTDKRNNQIILQNVVSTDEGVEIPVGSGLYSHEMMQLEETKILEGIVVDALTFLNDLGRDYANYNQSIDVTVKEQNFHPPLTPALYPTVNQQIIDSIKNSNQPKAVGSSFTFPSMNKIFLNFGGYVTDWERMIHMPSRNDFNYGHNDPPYGGANINDHDVVVLSLEEGKYEASYWVDLAENPNPTTSYKAIYEMRIEFSFRVVANIQPLPKWNIASVINRLLDVAEPHLKGVAPRFHLNEQQAQEFASIDAFSFVDTPEFALPSGTLKEDLDIIGGYIHGIPRLRGNEISFDMLGGTEQAAIADPKYPYITNIYSQDIESYCSSLDSTVDNFVSVLDDTQGTVTEPYDDGYKTVRTETVYARLDENNMFIATQMAIQELISVKCGIIPGTDVRGGDITAYVFESAEYNRMSSYDNQYPNSKAYALYYTQGTPNIYGLNFKLTNWTGVVFENYAIVNILRQATGKNVSVSDYPLLAFQVTYKPIFSARVQQTKQNISGIKQARTLVYNQGANLVETRYYGENLKGAVARMGNVDRIITYNLSDFTLIPEIGQMYGDDYYISGVACEMYASYIKCMLTLSQDFNRLSQYIGINSVKRFYEVSEKQAYDRHIKYADYVVIGDGNYQEDAPLSSLESIKQAFTQSGNQKKVSFAIAQGYDDNNKTVGKKVCLPVVAAAFGNAMSFTFKYEDNYSAGAQVKKQTSGKITGYFTNSVEYSDYYGRIPHLSFSMQDTQPREASSAGQDARGMLLPQALFSISNPLITTGDSAITIQKNNGESILFTYVLEIVANNSKYVIGSSLARNCPLVHGNDPKRKAALYILPNRIGKFVARVSLQGATKVNNYITDENIIIGPIDKPIIGKFSDFTPQVSGVAWAIVVEGSGELLLGSNETVTAGQVVQMPSFTLKHNIFD